VESHYLPLLPIRRAEAEANGGSKARQPIRLADIVAMLALLSISSVAALAFERLIAHPNNDVLPGWPAGGCLTASLEPLSVEVMVTRASLCSADRTIRATLDLENLEPNARYIVWVVYFANWSLCDPGPLLSEIQTPRRLCTLADLEDHGEPVSVHAEVETTADAHGVFHVDKPVRAITTLAPHSYVWLIVAPPQWSPVPHPTYRSVDADTGSPVARAVFAVPCCN
jgi:hypothetical protein